MKKWDKWDTCGIGGIDFMWAEYSAHVTLSATDDSTAQA
jgi:hypothetical protein